MNDESGQGDELESLKYVIAEYVSISELKNMQEYISYFFSYIKYYFF